MRRWYAAMVLSLAMTNVALAQENTLKIEVTLDKRDHVNAPLTIPLGVPKAWARFDEVKVEYTAGEEKGTLVGQLTEPGITTDSIKPAKEGLVRRDLHLLMPSIGKARSCQLLVHFEKVNPQVTRFAWTEKKGEYQELILTRSGTFTRFLRYMNRPYDASSADARNKSYKVFHHLYDPAGKRFVTNGGHVDDGINDPTKLVWPHHRGIMYGFNKCTYGPDLKQQADTWHCPPQGEKKKIANAAHVEHEKTLSSEAGPVLGRHRVLIGWFGDGDKPFAKEERELTVYNVPGGRLVEFASRLKTTGGKVRVDGDPQHAGFQFRAANDVAVKTKKQTYFLHPDGKGEMGKELNWPTDKAMVDLPWYAVSFVLDDQRYTVCYLNHPTNPKNTCFSERDYGRIGGYFSQDITEDRPLVVNYRLWLQTGEMTQEQAAALQKAFASPPKAVLK
jgi:Methane oxygenase PmoA